MSADKILMIPFLSKELNLIGHPTLPYVVKKYKKKKLKTSDDEDSDDDASKNVKIVFDSRKMVEALASVCLELVKKVKAIECSTDDREIDKVKFHYSKVKKQLDMSRKDYEKKMNELAAEKEKNRQLQVKLESLERQIRDCEVEKKKVVQRNMTNEDVLKHNLKRKEADLTELHKAIWKQFNMADRNFFPKNFEVIQLDQPDFNKLWSEVKHSSPKSREEALKLAICKFQENNSILMQDNTTLKTLLLATLTEVNEATELMLEKMHINDTPLSLEKINEILKDVETINVDMYRNVLNEHFGVLKKAFELFEASTFSISDDVFICWSDLIKKSQNLKEQKVN